ncbi:E3 ubiquitin-protein ligase HERC2 [Corynascus novoguineensis]|uniref:E3 ubiquitin-protein ligase HERC2 n=1 Tax=Corynascus novoguineensis TaxID=1126955 RepID=A0AAN7D1E1_9PEZI|nr:E3 ubiquitin-protein ligase HERC2 [Corynascus novoguineensis]
MVLYATGFNAWNQLKFEVPGIDEPNDIQSFTCVLREDAVEDVHPFLSYTQVHDGIETLQEYPSLRSLVAGDMPSRTFPKFRDLTQLVAFETGFAALTSTGKVWTWGDERYAACLGREVSDESPADAPGPVPDLDDLPTGPVTKLAAGGYVLAAITAGNDLYCWGHAGRSPLVLPPDRDGGGLSDAPSPVVVIDNDNGNDKDVIDVAVGAAHMLVLTAEGEVYVIGDNANGQLGLPAGVSATETWTRVDLAPVLAEGENVMGVAAGPRNSFLIAQ